MNNDIRVPSGTPFTPTDSPSLNSHAPTLLESYDSDLGSEHRPVALAVQPLRHIQNQVQLLENKARLTSLRLSVLSAQPGPTVPSTPATLHEFQQELRSKPSSILWGEESRHHSRPGTSSRSKTLKGQQSTSTLHSHYEPEKIPLTISQQTSDSSARDFALRKGYRADVVQEKQRKHFFETSKSRAKSKVKKQQADPVDISALFPKPGAGAKPDNAPYYKMNVKRPRVGTKHWFDSYEEELSDTESNNEPEMKLDLADVLQNAFLSLSTEGSPVHELPGSLAAKARVPGTAKSSRLLGIPDPTPYRPAIIDLRSGFQANEDIPKSGMSTVSPFQSVDLQEQSVLFLSSDDEDEAPVAARRPATRLSGAPIRDSIAVEVLDDTDIEVGTARTVRSQPAMIGHQPSSNPSAPRSDPGLKADMRVVVPTRRSSRMASFFAELSPLLQQDDEPSKLTTSSSSSTPDEDILPHNSRPEDTSEGSMMSLPIEKSGIAPSELAWDDPLSSVTNLDWRVSTHLMSVTRQEQMLLAAMRSKKAHMRHRSVHQEDSERWKDERDLGDAFYQHRPRTSADVNAPAFLDLGQNTYADWASRRRSSFVADSARQNDGWRESVTTFQTTSHRASTRLSTYPSDESQEVPVSASGRNSGLQRTSTGMGTHFSLSSDDYHSHARSGTDSSHIVVLDDLNDSPKDQENSGSPRFPSWAYNGWSDTAGLATAH